MEQVVGIYLITVFFSFGIQAACYFFYKLTRHALVRDYKHVFNYSSGFIGDGILVPLTNVFAYKTLEFTQAWIEPNKYYIGALMIGITISFIFHFGQRYYNLINWTMTRQGHWNTLGFYHMMFMFAESTFLGYTLIMYIRYIKNHGIQSILDGPMKLAVYILILFFITFAYDYWKPLFKKHLVKKNSPSVGDAYRKLVAFINFDV